jgi:predicted enzyme related to lactoylglutathione lyase
LTGPVGYHHVTDIKKSVQILLEAGGHVQQAIKDVSGGKLIAIVKDSDGNMIGFIQMPYGIPGSLLLPGPQRRKRKE